MIVSKYTYFSQLTKQNSSKGSDNVNLREARHLLEVRHCPCTMSVQFQLQLPRQKAYFYIQCCSQMKEKECWYPVSFETMVQVERRLDHHHLRKRNCLPTRGVGEGGGDDSGDDSGDDNSTGESFLVTGGYWAWVGVAERPQRLAVGRGR